MKITNQRNTILKFLKDNQNHPSVEEIFEKVKRTLPRTTKATVYKNLKTLMIHDIIKEVNIKGVSRFEAKIDPHHHIICKNCGKIIDFESEELRNFALQIIGKQKDFTIDSAETNFFGKCNMCDDSK